MASTVVLAQLWLLHSISIRAEQTSIGCLAPYDGMNSFHSQFLENSQNLMCKHNDSGLFLEMTVNSSHQCTNLYKLESWAKLLIS